MRSGRGFHNSCNNVYVKAFCDEMANMRVSSKNGALKYTSEEVGDMSLPLHWEFTKSPWYFGLLVKIFRRDPQLALHVADVITDKNNLPVSRAAMRRERQQAALQERNNPKTPSPPTDSSVLTTSSSGVLVPDMNLTPSANVSIATSARMPTSYIYQEKLLRAKMMASKAHAESTNIAKRMGKLEELKQGMALLKEMRSVIGEATYANGVCSLHAALPNFDTFNAAVDIIDVDNNTAPTPWGATKRCLSSGDEEWTKKTIKRSSNDYDDGNDGDDGNGLNVNDQHAEDKEERSTTEEEDNDEGNENGKGDYVSGFVHDDEDDEEYIKYHDIVDSTGKVVAVLATKNSQLVE
jgi:hypothetical protein